MFRRRTPQLLAAALILGTLGGWAARAAGPTPATPPAGASGGAGTAAPPAAAAPATPAAAEPSTPAAAAPAAPAAAAPAAAEPSTPAAAALQPPDGHWLTDKDGRKYFLAKVKKVEGRYIRLDKNHVRASYGVTIEIAKEDKDFYYVRVDQIQSQGHGPDPRPKPPTAEELAAAAASYKADTLESHRLRFVDFGHGLPTSGQWRHGFDIADMNGDGHLDIVHGPPRKNLGYPVIFLGDGKGNWKRWTDAKFPDFPYDYGDAKVADLKGDGHLGIVLGMHLRGLTALAGDGKGNFTNWNQGLEFALPGKSDVAAFSSRAITVVDWNRDGRPDILANGEGPRLDRSGGRVPGRLGAGSDGPVLYLNQGDGTWKRKDQGVSAEQGFGDGITVGDFNGDGRPDFATASGNLGYGKLVHLQREDGGWDDVELDVRPGIYVGAVAAGDFDRDGRSDLAVGYVAFELGVWRHGIDVFYSRAGGKWERRTLIAGESKDNVTALGVGDLDGDGNLDLVALTSGGEAWVFLGDGKGFFTREAPGIPPYPGGCWGYHAQLADLDGDGKDEIVASFAGESNAMNAPGSCPSEGGIAAWKAVPATGRRDPGKTSGSTTPPPAGKAPRPPRPPRTLR
jgi:hypothetical protein